MSPLQMGFYGIIGAIGDRDTQAAREGMEGYHRVSFDRSGSDCDGPYPAHKERTLYLSEDEIPFLLADFFGLAGWEYECDPNDPRIGRCHKGFKTDEGFESRTAWISWRAQS